MRLIGDDLVQRRVEPRPVAVVRIVVGIAVVSNTLESAVVLQRVASGRIRVPVLEWLPPPTSVAVAVCAVVGVLAGVALALGYHPVPAALLTVALNVWVFVWDQQTFSNHRVLATLIVAYLVFAQSDARWSVKPRRDALTTVRWWPQLLIMTQVSTCYLYAALNKVNAQFLDGDVFATWLRWPLPDLAYPLMAVATVLGELFLAWAFWWRRTRPLAVVVGVALHTSIVLGMAEQTLPLVVFGMTCVSTYWLWFTRPVTAESRLPSTPLEVAR